MEDAEATGGVIDGGTWEHRKRAKEMLKTAETALSLTIQAKNAHHMSQYLPKEVSTVVHCSTIPTPSHKPSRRRRAVWQQIFESGDFCRESERSSQSERTRNTMSILCARFMLVHWLYWTACLNNDSFSCTQPFRSRHFVPRFCRWVRVLCGSRRR